MLLLSGSGKRVQIAPDDEVLIGRGSTGMIPPDPCVSRHHLTIRVLSAHPLSVRLTQRGKQPTLVYRRDDLAQIGWLAHEQDQPQPQPQPLAADAYGEGADAAKAPPPAAAPSVHASSTAEQLAARDRLAVRLKAGESKILEAGDAFGIRGETLLWPFWIAELPGEAAATAAAVAAAAEPAAAAAGAAADCADSHSSNSSNAPFTPPRRRLGSRSPSHVSCASLSPHSLSRRASSSSASAASPSAAAAAPIPCAGPEAGVMGPVSPFYQTLRTDSLRAAMAAARQADGGREFPTPATALLLREAAAAEDEADRRRQDEEATLWNLDQYPHAKRRKIAPASEVGADAAAAGGAAGVRAATSLFAAPAASAASSAALSGTAQSHSRPALVRAPATTAAAATSSANAAAASSPSPVPAVAGAVPGLTPDPSPVPPTLVLPSLSTGDFHFSPEKTCPIAERAVRYFMQCYPQSDIRVTMLLPAALSGELSESSRAVAAHFESHAIDPRFACLPCTDPSALGALGLRASVLVHATTYRFQGGEGGVINKYLEPDFGPRMHGRHGAARTGRAYASAIDPAGALAVRCPGLRYLLSVRPPNMNPARPDCLSGDYLRGCRELRETYDAVFKQFAELAGLARNANASGAPVGAGVGAGATAGGALHIEHAAAGAALVVSPEQKDPVLASLSQRGSSQSQSAAAALAHSPSPPAAAAAAAAASARPSSSPGVAAASTSSSSASSSVCSSTGGLSSFVPPSSGLPPYRPPSTPPPKPSGHFSSLLYAYVKQPRPAALQPSVLWEDDDFTVIYDAYPKARVHLLMLPRRRQIAKISALTPADVPLLDAMEARGKWIANSLAVRDSAGRPVPIRLGYHAIPSLSLLHLHIVSSDLESPSLKNKKHWNSFATPFFVSPARLRTMLLQGSAAVADAHQAAAASFFSSSQGSGAALHAARSGTLESQLAAGERLLTTELRCHRQGCGIRCTNLPELRKHLAQCPKPYPV